MLNTHHTKITGFGGSPLFATGLLFGRNEIRTASGLGLNELANSGYDLRKLSRRSKTVKQAIRYDAFLYRQVHDMQRKELVVIA